MALLKHLLLVNTTWLTAAAMLFAGLPHVQCLCASTQNQAVPSRRAANETGCCCGKCPACGDGASCCQRTLKVLPRTSSCRQATADDEQDQRIEGPRCMRGLVHSTHPTIVAAPTNSKDSIASGAILCPMPILQIAPATPIMRSALACALAPPVDLICLLQHLVI